MTSRLLPSLQGILLCLIAGYAGYALISVWAALRWRAAARRQAQQQFTPCVSLLKPLRGLDTEARANLTSFCRQDYPPERLQILLCALDPNDPALDLARELAAEYPHLDILVLDGRSYIHRGLNRKVCNLLAMLPHARHDILILSDSDMRVGPGYVSRVVAPFRCDAPSAGRPQRPVGLVTCPYRGAAVRGLAASLEAIGIGADFIPSTLVSRALEGVGFAFGSTIALTRRALDAIGGFEVLVDELADDFLLGAGVRNAGFEAVLSDYIVDDVIGRERLQDMWTRRLRWARTVRACRPSGYAGSVVTHGIAIALIFVASCGFSAFGWMVLAGVMAVRLAATGVIAGFCTRDRAVLRLLPLLALSDLVSFAIFGCSYLGRTIVWRGERFRLLPGGKLAR